MMPNCDCGACCEACGHYDDCIRNAGRELSVADEIALEDGYRPSQGASLIKHPTHKATREHLREHPLPEQQDRRTA